MKSTRETEMRVAARFLRRTGGMMAGEMAAARKSIAGDEWVDGETMMFAREVAKAMMADRDVDAAEAEGHTVRFVYRPSLLVSIPLVLSLTEFGRGNVSESVEGTIRSEEVRGFRIPGGFTKSRDARELWRRGKANLADVMRRAR
jgi:hypothetical protein